MCYNINKGWIDSMNNIIDMKPRYFDDSKTNYIDIVASCELSCKMIDLLNKLAEYLNSELVEEE